jgi:hypothetical protein
MTSALPNPFEFEPSSRFILDEAAFMEAIEPLPVFLTAPRVDPGHEPDRSILPETLPSLSRVLRELSELAGLTSPGVRQP